ncbi:PREDICTED: uncharacterized protein LOC108560183 [Nicrophorus vespilloides]|uniref:Uncharacterized protein LOC108560183 n=1 Tax=Nicrophorus vespilloides TaxID=110193 RepID=A0ABM1MEX5_NICVS|nr:PREDICTED: uncharacterized protein LOC108560183 [Nicrophorus vespilloides]
MMDFLNKASEYFQHNYGYRRQDEREPPVMEKSRIAAYLNFIGWMISLETLLVSVMNFICCNIILLSFYVINLNMISTVCLIFMILVTINWVCDVFEVEEYPHYITEQQLIRVLTITKRCLIRIRRDVPVLFYSLLTVSFCLVYVVGNSMSGITVSYIAFLVIYFSKLIVKFMPSKIKELICRFIDDVQNVEGMIEESDLIPYNTDDSNGDKDTDLDSLLTDRTQESGNNSLASGLSTMPSHLDDDYIQDDTIQEDDLLPSTKPTKIDDSSDSDSSEHRNIEFDSVYFNKDSSSSEDENSYSKGLKFSDAVDSKKVVAVEETSLLSSPYLNIANFISNVMVKASQQQEVVQQEAPVEESDSDFEIINSEDVEDENAEHV